MNGKIASTRVKVVGGELMVPLADVARALGKSVVASKDGWEIKAASIQAGNFSGKLGSVVQTPKYSFAVLNLQTTGEYKSRFLKTPATFTADTPQDVLIIVNCRLKNTLPTAQRPVLLAGQSGNTALADNRGRSYKPKSYGSRIAGDYSGSSMLPGSTDDFALVFSVPKVMVIKDLVFTVTDYFELGSKSPDVRISLK